MTHVSEEGQEVEAMNSGADFFCLKCDAGELLNKLILSLLE